MATSPQICFPAELVEAVIDAAWSGPLAITERIKLMTTLPLINSTWRGTFLRVSSRDVHIPCAPYAEHYLSILRRSSPSYDVETQAYIESLCRTITFEIEYPSHAGSQMVVSHPTAKAMGNFFYFVSDEEMGFLPHLRTVRIQYHNMDTDDLFDNLPLVEFPSQVGSLDISFTFDDTLPSRLIKRFQSRCTLLPSPPWSMPYIKHLSLSGCVKDVITNMVMVCTRLEVLELTVDPVMEMVVPLPDSIRLVQIYFHANATNILSTRPYPSAAHPLALSPLPPSQPINHSIIRCLFIHPSDHHRLAFIDTCNTDTLRTMICC